MGDAKKRKPGRPRGSVNIPEPGSEEEARRLRRIVLQIAERGETETARLKAIELYLRQWGGGGPEAMDVDTLTDRERALTDRLERLATELREGTEGPLG